MSASENLSWECVNSQDPIYAHEYSDYVMGVREQSKYHSCECMNSCNTDLVSVQVVSFSQC